MEGLNDFTWDETVEGSIIETPATVTTKEKDLLNDEEDILPNSQASPEKDKEESEQEELIKSTLFSEDNDDSIINIDSKKENSSNSKDESSEEEEENEEESDKDKPADNNSSLAVSTVSNKTTLEYLVEKGVLEFGEDDEFEGELDEETSLEVLNLGIDKKADAKIKTMMTELDETTKEAVTYLLKGGDVNTLVGMFSNTAISGISVDMDLESEDNQVLLAKSKLKSLGEDDDDIETMIQHYKDTNKLAKYAEKAHSEWKEEHESVVAEENKKREDLKKKSIKENAEYRKKISDVVSKNEEVNGYKLPTSDTKTIVDYLTKPTEQLGDKRVVTGFQKEFMEAMKDPQKQVIIASLIKNNFNFSTVAKKQASKVTKNIQKEIQRQKENTIGKSSGSSHKPTGRLLDFLND